MKRTIRLIALLSGLLATQICVAQAPAGAPAGATGQCKDGTYSTAPSKSGACSGHKGIKTWYAAAPAATSKAPAEKSAPAPTAAAKPAPAPATADKAAPTPTPTAPQTQTHAAKSAPAPKSAASTTPAPGGGAGKVWLNTDSNVYHCSGTKYYGTTKAGAYMTESEAKAKGAHPDHGKPCS
jgi:hypothetical protein